MFDKNYILAPKGVIARFTVAPAFNALESIRELTETQRLSGLGEWVTQTSAALPEARLELNRMIFGAFQSMFFDRLPVDHHLRRFSGLRRRPCRARSIRGARCHAQRRDFYAQRAS